MRFLAQTLLFSLLLSFAGALPVLAQTGSPSATLEERVSELESDLRGMERKLNDASNGIVLILFGAFCALWAQNTGRNPWLWFFLGLFFNCITVLFLLYYNARDRRTLSPPA